MNTFRHRGVLFALLLVFALSLWGQIDTGTITGRVTDSTGAVIAGAQVVIVQTDTNFETLTPTNEEGLYRAQSLRPGPYRVTITANGFKRFVREGLALRTGDNVAVNVTLEVGAVSERVEVSGAAPLLETETSASGGVVNGEYFYSLPVYKRNVSSVLFFTPGVAFAGGPRGGDASVNGLPVSPSYFDDGQLGQSHTIMNTVEDIKVLTTTLPAEYGHSAGGAISVVKKSGTNQLHGIVSMFGRTRSMSHRKFFDLYRNSQVQPGWDQAPGYWFYQPDANINGPVYIPKLYDGRNKTFFMFAWQRQIEKQAKQQASTVPNQDMLNGDFNFGGIGQPIYDPRSRRQLSNGDWTADLFSNKTVPKSQWSKLSQKILGMNPYLLPNVAGSITATGPSGNIRTAPEKIYREKNWSLRLDQQFTPNLKAFVTWTYFTSYDRTPPWTKPRDNMFDSTQTPSRPTTNTPSAGVTWILSPTLITDIRAGLYRSITRTDSIAYMQDYAGQLGIPGLPKDTMPQGIGPSGFTDSLNVGGPSTSVSETQTVKMDTTKVQGKHAFKWGYELMRKRSNSSSPGSPSGSFSYTGTNGLRADGTSLPNTGNNFAAFLVGAVSSASYSRNLMSNLPRVWQHSFYLQDDWKIYPKLTLNIGLRYSLETPPSQKYGQISIFDPNAVDDSIYTSYTCPAGGCKGAWTHPTGVRPYNFEYTRLDPRLGLAWHPIEKLVIRTGFALDRVDMGTGYLYTDELMTESTSQAAAIGDNRPLFMIDNGPPPIIYPAHRADGSIPYRGNPGGHSANIVNRDMHAPYTMNWNYGIQYQLQKDYMVEVRYSGSAAVGTTGSYDTNSRPLGIIPDGKGGWLDLNLPANAAYRSSWLTTAQYSRPWPAWGNISLQGNNGHLTHHEGTVRLEKRYSKGLNLSVWYTLSKTLEGNSLNPYLDWSLSKGRPANNQEHIFTATMNYEIPIGKGRKWLNRSGWLDTVFGGFDLVWTYSIQSGNPTGMSISGSTAQQYPSWMPTYGDVMLLRNPELRDNWQDLGTDRFTQNNQNSMIDCGTFVLNSGNDCFVARPSFTNGTNGKNVWDVQRTIAANMSASKEVTIWERLKFQLRFDFSNPFKWYNLAAPNSGLSINSLSNSKSFGTASLSGEADTTKYGSAPLMNLTLALKW